MPVVRTMVAMRQRGKRMRRKVAWLSWRASPLFMDVDRVQHAAALRDDDSFPALCLASPCFGPLVGEGGQDASLLPLPVSRQLREASSLRLFECTFAVETARSVTKCRTKTRPHVWRTPQPNMKIQARSGIIPGARSRH